MTAHKYRTKPIEIDAIKWDGSIHGSNGSDAIAEWSGGKAACRGYTDDINDHNMSRFKLGIFIATLEGEMRADPGDYIIKGTEGEFYPCKPTPFEKKYEAIDA